MIYNEGDKNTGLDNDIWLIMLYGTATLVGYLMLNPVYPYILNIYDL